MLSATLSGSSRPNSPPPVGESLPPALEKLLNRHARLCRRFAVRNPTAAVAVLEIADRLIRALSA